MKPQNKISYTIDAADLAKVDKIVKRALKMNPELDELDLRMDIVATHANGMPLDFDRLLKFDAFNFMHDIYGISAHLNRQTGQIERCFLPRCAR